MTDAIIPTLPIQDWFPEQLRDAALRYEWAKTHLDKLRIKLREFDESSAWKAELSPDLPKGMGRIKIFRQPPREIALIIGDLVHSLRASLDYATCALVRIEDQTSDLNHVQFPFGKPGIPLNGRNKAQLRAISELGLPYIEEARRIGGTYLGVLNRVSNQDKHRLVAPMFYREMPLKFDFDPVSNTAAIVRDTSRDEVWARPLADGDVVEIGNMIALRPGFVVEGDEAPYPLDIIMHFFLATHMALCLMITAAEAMLTKSN